MQLPKEIMIPETVCPHCCSIVTILVWFADEAPEDMDILKHAFCGGYVEIVADGLRPLLASQVIVSADGKFSKVISDASTS